VKVGKRTMARAAVALVAGVAGAAAVAGIATGATSGKPYAAPVSGDYKIKALFSADDKLPLLGGSPGQQYRMVGIPDGSVRMRTATGRARST
jgi:hypothetical protein